ncbi:MAG: hypothetical protein ACKO28_10995 [Cyanobium sp.]
MRSARALQEAFGLRSTVAVLGFALRTLGQQLEEGKLDELAAQHRAQLGPRSGGGTGSARTEGRQRPEGGRSAEGRWQEGRGSGGRAAKVDPFARPSRPAVATQPIEEPSAEACLPEDLPSEFVDVLPPPLDSPDISQPANAASEEASQTPEE